MPEHDEQLPDQLSAFADGELDANSSLALMERLIGHPRREEALRFIRHARELTERTRQSARAEDGPSEALRLQIADMLGLASEPPDGVVEVRPASTRRSSWRGGAMIALATAAGVAIGVALPALWSKPATRGATDVAAVQPRDAILPSGFVTVVGRTHAACSRLAEGLHVASFEKTDAQLASVVRSGLHQPASADAPDLSSIGYRLVGVGPCHHAGPGVVHVLYRSTRPGSVAAISLFVQPDSGQFTRLDADRVYRVNSNASPFPTLAWRGIGAVYLLLADDESTSLAALQTLRPTAKEAIVVASVARQTRKDL
jgi:anti-sigma factor RsiW